MNKELLCSISRNDITIEEFLDTLYSEVRKNVDKIASKFPGYTTGINTDDFFSSLGLELKRKKEEGRNYHKSSIVLYDTLKKEFLYSFTFEYSWDLVQYQYNISDIFKVV